jgi:hypothetical protein
VREKESRRERWEKKRQREKGKQKRFNKKQKQQNMQTKYGNKNSISHLDMNSQYNPFARFFFFA